MKLKTLKITAGLLVCTMFLPACGKKEDADNTNTNKTAQEETKGNDYRAFMMTISEKFVKEKFGATKVKIKAHDFTAIHTDEVLKSLDGQTHENTILATGDIEIDGTAYKYQIIADVDNLDNPQQYTVLNFETINPESEYEYDNLED